MSCQVMSCLLVKLHVIVQPLLVAAHVGVDTSISRLGTAHSPTDQTSQHHAVLMTIIIGMSNILPPVLLVQCKDFPDIVLFVHQRSPTITLACVLAPKLEEASTDHCVEDIQGIHGLFAFLETHIGQVHIAENLGSLSSRPHGAPPYHCGGHLP